MAPRAVLITNPFSGAATGGTVEQAVDIIESKGTRVEVVHTAAPGHATELAARAASEAPDLIIAAGGDGTINEVINGMAKSQVPLAILPFGSTNVLARELDIPLSPAEAAHAALERPTHRVALGRLTYGEGSRYFILMAGFGFDALSVLNVSKSLKRRIGKLAYVVSAFRSLAAWRPQPVTVTANGKEYRCSNAIISNARKYGGDFVMAPEADISAPELHITLLRGMGRLDILRLSMGLLTGRHTALRGVEHFRARQITLDGTLHIQIDGDYAGKSPAEVTVEADALSLVY